jgi:hypothetical protein
MRVRGPLDRYRYHSVAARIAQRTHESLFRFPQRAVNKKPLHFFQFQRFFFIWRIFSAVMNQFSLFCPLRAGYFAVRPRYFGSGIATFLLRCGGA